MTTEPAPRPPVRGMSFFLTIPTDPDPGRVYTDALHTVRLAERHGFETVWAAEGHFTLLGLPAALSFLAAAAQVSTTVRLGTAVLPLAFDHPVRVAETAAFVDALSGGRLELGVGKSNPGRLSSTIFTAFGLAEGDRERIYEDALADLKRTLVHGVSAGAEQVPLHPPGAELTGRLWQATGNPVTAAAVGRAGDGLLLFRATPEGDAGQVQSVLVDAYLDALPAGAEPRVGISRGVLPAASRTEALAVVRAEMQRRPDLFVTPVDPAPGSAEEFLAAMNVKYGSPEDVLDQLALDAAFVRSTDHLFSLPIPAGTAAFREGLALIADEIGPRVGGRHVLA